MIQGVLSENTSKEFNCVISAIFMDFLMSLNSGGNHHGIKDSVGGYAVASPRSD